MQKDQAEENVRKEMKKLNKDKCMQIKCRETWVAVLGILLNPIS